LIRKTGFNGSSMKHPTENELRKQARATELRRNFGVIAPVAITMVPPPDEAVFKQFTLSSGRTYRPSFGLGGRVIVNLEADAVELQREGWIREK
jgi:hypothetical protein